MTKLLLTLCFYFSLNQVYLFKDTTCDVPNCNECTHDKPNECKYCHIEYYNKEGHCFKKSYSCKDSDCISCASYNSTCTECIPGYLPAGENSCEWKCGLKKCKLCGDDPIFGDKCKECNSGYSLYTSGSYIGYCYENSYTGWFVIAGIISVIVFLGIVFIIYKKCRTPAESKDEPLFSSYQAPQASTPTATVTSYTSINGKN